MRIGIDARSLTRIKTGIGQYTANLVRSMAQLAPNDEFILFSNQEIVFPKESNCHFVVKGQGVKSNVWLQTVMPWLLLRYGVELLHSPAFLLPLINRVPSIITVHDLVHEIYPDTTDIKNRLPLKLLLPLSLKKAGKIVAVSENTKKDICQYYNVDVSKIQVIYLGCDSRFQPVSDNKLIHEVRKKHGLPEKYILTVGTLEPRKNLIGLFKAFSKMLKICPETEYRLVVVGMKGWKYSKVFSEFKGLNLEGKVVIAGYVPDNDLPLIYGGADVFVFPSFYEGFGLPPLEAMSCGIPVITSNVGSLPEVVGNGALFIDPRDESDLCQKLISVLFDAELRRNLIIRGQEQVKKFSWQHTARETLALYRELWIKENKKGVNL